MDRSSSSICPSLLIYPVYRMPNGLRTFSLATLFATSPPFCSAKAPMMAIKDCDRTTSIPEVFMRSGYLGFHLVTLSNPYDCASGPRRSLERAAFRSTERSFGSPASAGCSNAVRPKSSWTVCGSWLPLRTAMLLWRTRIRLPVL